MGKNFLPYRSDHSVWVPARYSTLHLEQWHSFLVLKLFTTHLNLKPISFHLVLKLFTSHLSLKLFSSYRHLKLFISLNLKAFSLNVSQRTNITSSTTLQKDLKRALHMTQVSKTHSDVMLETKTIRPPARNTPIITNSRAFLITRSPDDQMHSQILDSRMSIILPQARPITQLVRDSDNTTTSAI